MSSLTEFGPALPTEREFLRQFQRDYEILTGEEQDWRRDEFLGALAIAYARMGGHMSGTIQALWDSLDRETARGAALEAHAAIVGIKKQKPTHSSVVVTLTGEEGTIVEEGRQVRDDNDHIWELQEDVEIPGEGLVRAVEPGPISVSPGEITSIETPVSGWEEVFNDGTATVGSRRESDPELRLRIRERLRSGTGSSFRGIANDVEELSFVESSITVHNPTPEEQEVKGITLPRNSFAVVIHPPELTEDEKEEVFDAIFDSQPIGIRSYSDAGPKKYIENFPVTFSYSEPLGVELEVEVELEEDYNISLVASAGEDSLDSYVENLGLGQDILLIDIISTLRNIDGVRSVGDIEITIVGPAGETSYTNENIEVSATEFPVSNQIEVTEK